MKRHLLENLLNWIRSTRPAELPNDSAGEIGTLRNQIDKELWDIRAEKLNRQIARYNLQAPPEQWLPDCHGEYPAGRIEAMAAPFDRVTVADARPARTMLSSGAFRESLARGCEISCNIDHNRKKIVARTSKGEMRVWIDSRGLWLRALLCGNFGRHALNGIRYGALTGCSIEYIPGNYRVTDIPSTTTLITRGDLTGIAIVSNPAFLQTNGTIFLEERKND